ncbi:MAG TPA: BlaI/MecI/CopY family transcriptional regulator [Steroidobacteraceae bacterium]|nr:BlaI/MecI/CopY family transcriptional regulator [Steroidobacteraceae bacterium]
MASPKISKLEMKVMEVLWAAGPSSVREIHDAFPKKGKPAYTTVQTIVYRLEEKGAVRRAKKIGNANIFEAIVTRDAAQKRWLDEVLALFGGRSQPLMSHLIETGKLTMDDIRAAEKLLREHSREEK